MFAEKLRIDNADSLNDFWSTEKSFYLRVFNALAKNVTPLTILLCPSVYHGSPRSTSHHVSVYSF